MCMITIQVWDATGIKRQEVELPDDVPVRTGKGGTGKGADRKRGQGRFSTRTVRFSSRAGISAFRGRSSVPPAPLLSLPVRRCNQRENGHADLYHLR
jgi:hypothetical protein